MKFSLKIKELRIGKELSQATFAKIMQVEQATISTWEKGIRQPDYDTLVRIAFFFNVTTDFLLGLENEDGTKTYDQRSYENKGSITYNNK